MWPCVVLNNIDMSSSAVNRIQSHPAPAAASGNLDTKTRPRQRKVALKEDTKKIIYNAYKYFKKRKTNKDSFKYQTDANISKLVAMATGVREGTVKWIISERNTAIERTEAAIFCDPKYKKPKAKFNVNDHLGRIRKIIYQMYTVEKDFLDLRKLAATLKQNDNINYEVKTLRKLLLNIGYYYEKQDLTRYLLLERPDVTEKRFDYLISMFKCRSKNKHNIYFIGDTKINPILYGDVGQGCGLYAMVAGNRNGLIADSLVFIESNEIKPTTVFHEWVENKLKNKLPLNSVIVMGSESYYCMETEESPTMESLKHELHQWMDQRGICYTQDMSKVELLKIIKSIPSQKNYKVHKILQGHTVLHLPPFHMDLNPMWLVLRDVKEDLLRECVLTYEDKCLALKRLFSEYPVDRLQNYFDIISNTEKEYFSYDMKMDKALDELILRKYRASSADSSDLNNEDEDLDSTTSTTSDEDY